MQHVSKNELSVIERDVERLENEIAETEVTKGCEKRRLYVNGRS